MFGQSRRGVQHPGEIALDGSELVGKDYSEIARFWVSDDRAVTLVSTLVASPTLLGSLLVECVHTAADAYAHLNSVSREVALAELWKGFDEERKRLQEVEPEGNKD